MKVKSESPILNRCFTCLSQSENCMEISTDAIEPGSVTAVDALTKHFWFQRDEFTKARHVLCANCWKRLDDFHCFYQKVEENHRTLNGKLSAESDLTENGIDQMYFEVEIKEEDSWHQSGDVESDCENSTVSSSNETQNGKLEEQRSSNQTVQSESGDGESDYEKSLVSSSNDPQNEKLKEQRTPNQKEQSGRTIREGEDADEIIKAHTQYNCAFCEKHCTTFNDLRAHIEGVHKKRAFVLCCGKRYSRRFTLLEHVLKLEKRFKCDICGKVLGNTKSLLRHIHDVHVTKEENKYQCNHCSKSFLRARFLRKHMELHTNGEDKEYEESTTCPHCKKRFLSVYATKRHIKVQHEHEKNLSCNVCDKKFALNWVLQRHIDQHRSLEDQRAQCNVCQKWLKNKNSLYMHSLMHTTPAKCDICGTVVKHRLALAKHKLTKHGKNQC